MLSPDELEKRYQQKMLPAQQPQGRGLAGLLPVAGGVLGSIIGTPVIGGAVGAGAGELLAQFLTPEKENPLDIGKEALLGGAGGFVGKLLGAGKGASQVAKAAAGAEKAVATGTKAASEAAPKTLERGVGTTIRQAPLKTGMKSISQLDDLTEMSRVETKYNITGSPIARAEKAKSAVTNVDGEIRGLLINQPTVKKLPGIATMDFNDEIVSSNLSRYSGEPAYDKIVRKATAELKKASKGGDPLSLYNLKSQVADRSAKYLETLAKGAATNTLDTPTSIQLQVDNALFNSIRNTLDKIAPKGALGDSIRGLNADQNALYTLGKAALGGAERGMFAGGGITNIASRPIQAAQDLVGRGVQTVEEGVKNIPLVNKAVQAGAVPATAGQFGSRALLGGQEAPTPNQESLLNTGTGQVGSTEPLLSSNVPAGTSLDAETAAQAILAYPQYASQIKSAYELLNQNKGGGSQSDEFITKAADNISVVMQAPKAGYGPVQGRAYEASLSIGGGVGVPEEATALNERYQLLKLNILRAYQGARISDADFKLASQYVPNITDTDATARTKLKELQSILLSSKPPMGADLSRGLNTGGISEDVLAQFGL